MLRVSVDGVVMPAGTVLDNTVPMDVHGVQVFFGPSRAAGHGRYSPGSLVRLDRNLRRDIARHRAIVYNSG